MRHVPYRALGITPFVFINQWMHCTDMYEFLLFMPYVYMFRLIYSDHHQGILHLNFCDIFIQALLFSSVIKLL
jgi:hypothetical protein